VRRLFAAHGAASDAAQTPLALIQPAPARILLRAARPMLSAMPPCPNAVDVMPARRKCHGRDGETSRSASKEQCRARRVRRRRVCRCCCCRLPSSLPRPPPRPRRDPRCRSASAAASRSRRPPPAAAFFHHMLCVLRGDGQSVGRWGACGAAGKGVAAKGIKRAAQTRRCYNSHHAIERRTAACNGANLLRYKRRKRQPSTSRDATMLRERHEAVGVAMSRARDARSAVFA